MNLPRIILSYLDVRQGHIFGYKQTFILATCSISYLEIKYGIFGNQQQQLIVVATTVIFSEYKVTHHMAATAANC